MTNDEFLAWFAGLSRKIKNRPSKEDWAEILAKIESVEAKSVVKAWLKGRLSGAKGLPNDKLWREIKDHLAAEQEKASTGNRLRNPLFDAFGKKN